MNLREYNRLKQEAAAEYKRKLDAIEMVWKLSGGLSQNGPTAHGTPLRKGSLHEAVRSAIQLLTGDFNVRDVERQIKDTDPELAAKIKRASLSSALKRLVDEKQIVLVAVGTGKRASTYRKPSG